MNTNDNKPYSIKLLPDLSTMLVENTEGYNTLEHMGDLLIEARKMLDDAQEPLFVINSFTIKSNMGDVMTVTKAAALGEDPIWKHPNIRGMFWVTTDMMEKLAIKGLDSFAFGNLKHTPVDTLEEAAKRIREKLDSD